MRHQKVGRKLKRTASHRKALLSALSTALIKHKKIRTTTAKAKETRRIIEPIITRARDAHLSEKSGNPVDVHARREVAKFIRDKDAVKVLFTEIAEKVGKRPGGYTRVIRLGNRFGDGADMAVIELVDYNEAQDTKKRRDRVARSKAAEQRRKAAEARKAEAPVKEKAPPVAEEQPLPEQESVEPIAEMPEVETGEQTPEETEEKSASADQPETDEEPKA